MKRTYYVRYGHLLSTTQYGLKNEMNPFGLVVKPLLRFIVKMISFEAGALFRIFYTFTRRFGVFSLMLAALFTWY